MGNEAFILRLTTCCRGSAFGGLSSGNSLRKLANRQNVIRNRPNLTDHAISEEWHGMSEASRPAIEYEALQVETGTGETFGLWCTF